MSVIDPTPHSSSSLHGSYAYTDTLKGIYYGPGCVEAALPKLLEVIGAKRALIVTGRSLYEKTSIISQIQRILESHPHLAHAGTFHHIGQHTPIAGIRAGVEAFRASKADVIVSVGGGSPIDAAKAMVYYMRKEEEEGGVGEGWVKTVAIPTTLSAAEYTVGAGYTDESGAKVAVSAQELAPAGIILDAELTLATPERLWLSTGIRALDHAVENLYRPLTPPPLKHLSHAALSDLFKYLPLSKSDPGDVVVRQKLQVASWMSIWPGRRERYSALGLSHSLGHKLGAAYGIPHGITSCLTLSPVVSLQAQIGSEEDKEWLAGALFQLRIPSVGTVEGDVLKLSSEIQRLVDALGLGSTLAEYRVPRADLGKIARLALGVEVGGEEGKVVGLLEGIYD